MLHLLPIGCNYPDESYALPDCEADAESDVALFEPYVSSSTLLLSRKATYKGIIKAVENLCDRGRDGDAVLLSFSGHGTSERIGGKLVQGIVANDGIVIYERLIRQILNNRPPGVIALMMSDCCHSHGLVRGNPRIIRSIPMRLCRKPNVVLATRMPIKPNVVYSGCKTKEYAYSTGNGGAVHLARDEAFAERGDRTTLRSLHTKIRKRLPSKEWPQTPQFYCRSKALAKRTIRSFAN